MRYVIDVVPIPRIADPFTLGPYRWRWRARFAIWAIKQNALLKSATQSITIRKQDT